jgi:ligand-binding SRPBCC domain-containing protein
MPYNEVFAGFTKELFIQLAPPFPRLTLERFDGCRTGDIIHLRIHLPLLPAQHWVGMIVEHGEIRNHPDFRDEYFFVDEATTLPFFLKSWRHTHRAVSAECGSVIIDAIEFKAWGGLDLLVYPFLWLNFAYRQPVYRRVFSRQAQAGANTQETQHITSAR